MNDKIIEKNSDSCYGYSDKILLIQSWIDEINNGSISEHNIPRKIELIGRTMKNQITDFFDGFSGYGFSESGQPNDDVDLLKLKLENYLADIKIDAEKLCLDKMKLQVNFSSTLTQSQSQAVSVHVTIDNVFKEIEKSALSDEEKEELKDKISGINSAINTRADKKKVWGKIKCLLGWMANKAIDVGLAVTLVPYLGEILKGLGL